MMACQLLDRQRVFAVLRRVSALALVELLWFTPILRAQQGTTPSTPATAATNLGQSTGKSGNGKSPSPRSDTKAAGGSDESNALAAAAPPPGPTGRPSIGLALGGGGALALSEIGVLEWFQEHHIPVDMVAGTSMGCMVGALYSIGTPIDRLKVVMNDSVFNQVFRFDSSYSTRSFRRRQDSRALPNGLTVGLRHGVSFRNSVLTDQGLNAFLDRRFFRYDDRVDFNTLPIPLRCIATDLTDARAVTFSRGSLPDAVRASVSLPAVYQPFQMDGHEYVDGGVLDNLPTSTVRDMKADTILAVSLPLQPVATGDLSSLLGVLQRSFSVAIEGAERQQRKLAKVVIMPDLTGFTSTDYLKVDELAQRGYEAAERQRDALLKYAVSDEQWGAYLAGRVHKERAAPGPVLRIRVKAPNDSVTRAIQRKFDPLVNQPVDTREIEARLAEIRGDGRYDADYSVSYELPVSQRLVGHQPSGVRSGESSPTHDPAKSHGEPDVVTDSGELISTNSSGPRPVINITVQNKTTGPPFVVVGGNVLAQTGSVARATVEGIFLWQDLGGYGSEFRGHVKVGFLTEVDGEYYRRLRNTGVSGGFYAAPTAGLLRQPFDIYNGDQFRVAERLLQRTYAGGDVGWSDSRTRDLRLGYDAENIRWQTQIGSAPDGEPDVFGSAQRVRGRFVYDRQDRETVPQYGIRSTTEFGYLFDAVQSPDAPRFTTQFSLAHQIDKNLFLFGAEAGTYFGRSVAQPFRFTLGGPFRLMASAIDEYRGTDYFLVEPVFLRRVARLPQPLGQSIYLGAGYEAGQVYAPGQSTVTRQDVYFGVIAETPLGAITLAPSVGNDGHRKFTFTLGKLF